MRVVKSIKSATAIIAKEKKKKRTIAPSTLLRTDGERSRTIGFVPTMGALHNGHFSLIQKARKENDFVAVSIFVNPLQFLPREDLKKYPRTFKQDYAACKKLGVDLIFYPSAKAMYPENFKTNVYVEDLSDSLCGVSRPGHFKGVTTIVCKLLNIIQPDVLYLGQKDCQQAVILKKMVSDLNMPIRVKVLPTLREKDGLALSSRNTYLTKDERKDALGLWQSLQKAKEMIQRGSLNSSDIIRAMRKIINRKKSAKIDYIQAVALDDLRPVKRIAANSLIALAVRIGSTRLIDNLIVK